MDVVSLLLALLKRSLEIDVDVPKWTVADGQSSLEITWRLRGRAKDSTQVMSGTLTVRP